MRYSVIADNRSLSDRAGHLESISSVLARATIYELYIEASLFLGKLRHTCRSIARVCQRYLCFLIQPVADLGEEGAGRK